jgi:hypothetical protein
MNRLHIGFAKHIDLPKGGYLFLDDEVPSVPRARVFDPAEHCFNPLKDIDYKKARELAELLYTVSPQGENTLTVRNGKRALLRGLLEAEPARLDQVKGDEEVTGMVGDILASPVLKRVLCTAGKEFSFNPRSVILARVSRAELGEFDALVLGLLLMSQFRAQIVCSDFGFYGRDVHANLIREGRLIAGVHFLGELPDKLRQAALSIKEKVASRATFEDAETLAGLAGLIPRTNEYNDFIQSAMG